MGVWGSRGRVHVHVGGERVGMWGEGEWVGVRVGGERVGVYASACLGGEGVSGRRDVYTSAWGEGGLLYIGVGVCTCERIIIVTAISVSTECKDGQYGAGCDKEYV